MKESLRLLVQEQKQASFAERELQEVQNYSGYPYSLRGTRIPLIHYPVLMWEALEGAALDDFLHLHEAKDD